MNTLHQLRCGGVLEAVRISCAGYPTKSLYPDFVDHFWNLGPELLAADELDDPALAQALLAKSGLKVGKLTVSTTSDGFPEQATHC